MGSAAWLGCTAWSALPGGDAPVPAPDACPCPCSPWWLEGGWRWCGDLSLEALWMWAGGLLCRCAESCPSQSSCPSRPRWLCLASPALSRWCCRDAAACSSSSLTGARLPCCDPRPAPKPSPAAAAAAAAAAASAEGCAAGVDVGGCGCSAVPGEGGGGRHSRRRAALCGEGTQVACQRMAGERPVGETGSSMPGGAMGSAAWGWGWGGGCEEGRCWEAACPAGWGR